MDLAQGQLVRDEERWTFGSLDWRSSAVKRVDVGGHGLEWREPRKEAARWDGARGRARPEGSGGTAH